jgi:hypothetical protein
MPYDDPALSDTEFLRAVRDDPKVDIADRVKAASALVELERDHGHAQPRVRYRRIVEPPSLTIRIECCPHEEFPMWAEWEVFSREQRAYFNTLPHAEQEEITRAVNRMMRCNELDTGPLTHMSEVKGHG